MIKAIADENQQMAKTKRDKEVNETRMMQRDAVAEVEFTTAHDFMTEHPSTEKSMLADHRVKPYHFKGLNQEQQNAILHERAQQVAEQQMMKTSEKDQEALWALQAEHMRRQQVLENRKMQRDLRAVEEGHRATQEQQKTEHGQLYKDPYGEKHSNMRGENLINPKPLFETGRMDKTK
jgi:hypothetical protein